jgi:hypothetical protein
MTNPPNYIRTTLQSQLVTIRAQMQAIETTLKPGQCALWECDALYGRQEAIRVELQDLDDNE